MEKDFRKLKQLREQKKLSLNQVASKINVSASYLCRIENNHRLNPKIDTLIALSDYYGVSLDELICIAPKEKDEESEI